MYFIRITVVNFIRTFINNQTDLLELFFIILPNIKKKNRREGLIKCFTNSSIYVAPFSLAFSTLDNYFLAHLYIILSKYLQKNKIIFIK